MNKKIFLIMITLIIVCITVIFIYNNISKNQPEEILQQYISLINQKKYEKMYNMITEDAKSKINQNDFIERNKNIYNGIDMSNIEIEIIQVSEDNKNDVKIEYKTSMDTSVGNIEFKNIAKLKKDKKEGYL